MATCPLSGKECECPLDSAAESFNLIHSFRQLGNIGWAIAGVLGDRRYMTDEEIDKLAHEQGIDIQLAKIEFPAFLNQLNLDPATCPNFSPESQHPLGRDE